MNKRSRTRIKAAVLNVLQAYGLQLSLPVPIKAIVKHFKNIRLIPYSTQMHRRHFTYDEMILFAGTEDACTDYHSETDAYIIYYNDVDERKINSNRYRWNIAHELGHIALGHHKKHLQSRIFRNSLSVQLYKELEAEADMFAAYILVPHIVISCITDKNQVDIKNLCKISELAATYRSDNIKRWSQKKRIERYDLNLLGYFSNFVENRSFAKPVMAWLNSHRVCSNCKIHIPVPDIRFCPICRAEFNRSYEMRRNMMKYSRIELDEQGRARECPVCHNTELTDSGTFCVICGNQLTNMCTNNETAPFSCSNSAPLPGHARYCPVCGSKSTFFDRSLLPSWNAEFPILNEDMDGDLPF